MNTPLAHHRGHRIFVAEQSAEALTGADEKGSYVVCAFAGGYAGFWTAGDDLVLLTGIQPMGQVDAVVSRLKEIIDDDFQRQARADERTANALAAAAVDDTEPAIVGNSNSEIPVSLSLLMQTHNALPTDAPERTAIRKWIASKARRPDWVTMGVVLRPDGTLGFDAKRYSTALWRAKQETYAKAAIEQLERTARDLQSINDFLNLEQAAIERDLPVEGEGLAPLPSATDAINLVNRAIALVLADPPNLQARIEGDNLDSGRSPRLSGPPK